MSPVTASIQAIDILVLAFTGDACSRLWHLYNYYWRKQPSEVYHDTYRGTKQNFRAEYTLFQETSVNKHDLVESLERKDFEILAYAPLL